ncbi:unnamed protein product [Vitrella brassicaformis CCMP3155]|uniref:Uncharacterized protein n=1 Tax=Vitrella brassicaformis (strain CCMP3155) TaxID=1169540 RepID=A0A0G4G0Y2_VITBC|nr:unnamed protein product [Vitrella brassicaformis CCMP3155]|eukprot:CEM21719.1 unnamed protein product [Vitrella brassicaformis CCMP3155]
MVCVASLVLGNDRLMLRVENKTRDSKPQSPGRAKVAYVKVVAPLVGQEIVAKDKNGNPVPQLTHEDMLELLRCRVAEASSPPAAQKQKGNDDNILLKDAFDRDKGVSENRPIFFEVRRSSGAVVPEKTNSRFTYFPDLQ